MQLTQWSGAAAHWADQNLLDHPSELRDIDDIPLLLEGKKLVWIESSSTMLLKDWLLFEVALLLIGQGT